jgi:hypothetical protein
MAFTLRDLLGPHAPVIIDECPSGKPPFPTKAAAQHALRPINRLQRPPMQAYRCDYCERYHIGHSRGHS